MKQIIKTIIFTALALYITSLWNSGFTIPHTLTSILITTLVTALCFRIILPISKIILFPFQILTFGLIGFFVAMFCFHIMSELHLIQIISWKYAGGTILGFSVGAFSISYLLNLALSALSVSVIIQITERLFSSK